MIELLNELASYCSQADESDACIYIDSIMNCAENCEGMPTNRCNDYPVPDPTKICSLDSAENKCKERERPTESTIPTESTRPKKKK